MNLGKLRHRISIERRTGVQNPSTGAMSYSWQKIADVYAEVTPVSVKEFITSQAANVELIARVKIRYREDIQNQDRITFRGKIYAVEGILPDPDSGLEYLTLPCSEGVKDG
ncbi:head-tail adaptor protein [Enterobacter cloacae]|uniref:Head-tail adaptor protein n=1 Tax=Enterobacter cloacae TaxID=550 RepID=A0A4Q2E857_ENTCL|nr:phage head closure protein [Enterobacter cloacae]RXW28971.1 head-tail adaptor protein [Enterobacter cloacae]